MWFAFGLVALPAALIGALVIRRELHWSGTRLGEYEYSVSNGKHRDSIKIAIPAPEHLELCVHPERSVDRWAKALGLSVEQQLDRPDFDARIYLQSDDTRVSRCLAEDAAARKAILDVFAWGRGAGAVDVLRMRAVGGRLFLDLTCDDDAGEEVAQSAGRLLVPRMQKVVAALRGIPKAPGIRDPFGLRAALVLAISSGILATAIVEYFGFRMLQSGHVLDPGRLFAPSVMAGLGLTALMVVFAFALLGRRSRTHIVLLELLTLGLAGSVLLAYVKLNEYNQEFDASVPVDIEAKIAGKNSFRCGRRGRSTCYEVWFSSWDREVDGESMRVSEAIYRQADHGDTWQLVKRQGALRVAWLESWEPTPD